MKKTMISMVLILFAFHWQPAGFAQETKTSPAAGEAPAGTNAPGTLQKTDSLSCGILHYGGQDYPTVKIGSQCWMTTNLNIGKWINTATEQKISDSGTLEKYCYLNDFKQCDYWGGLYQWGEMMRFTKTPGARGICPDGWHIPSSREWGTLIKFLGTDDDAGGRLKSTLQWERPNVGADNSSGFSAYPSGSFDYLANKWYDLYRQAYYWTSEMISATTAVGVNLTFRTGGINRYEEFQVNALSVRCVKD